MQEERFESIVEAIRYLKAKGETFSSLNAKSIEEVKISLDLNPRCTVDVDDDYAKSVVSSFGFINDFCLE